jgi:preprotein translocase subunit SecG
LYTTLIVIHLLVCFFLIFIVLIQSSKGAELGAAFGGSNQTLFGSRGASTFLNKLTTGVAVAFMLTSLSLAILASQRGSIMPETTPARELPAQPFTETAPIPAEEQSAETGQEPVQETPVQPSQPVE